MSLLLLAGNEYSHIHVAFYSLPLAYLKQKIHLAFF